MREFGRARPSSHAHCFLYFSDGRVDGCFLHAVQYWTPTQYIASAAVLIDIGFLPSRLGISPGARRSETSSHLWVCGGTVVHSVDQNRTAEEKTEGLLNVSQDGAVSDLGIPQRTRRRLDIPEPCTSWRDEVPPDRGFLIHAHGHTILVRGTEQCCAVDSTRYCRPNPKLCTRASRAHAGTPGGLSRSRIACRGRPHAGGSGRGGTRGGEREWPSERASTSQEEQQHGSGRGMCRLGCVGWDV